MWVLSAQALSWNVCNYCAQFYISHAQLSLSIHTVVKNLGASRKRSKKHDSIIYYLLRIKLTYNVQYNFTYKYII